MGITIVGLGSGNGSLLTRQAWEILTTAETIYLRTERHPAVAELPSTINTIKFDHYYETAENFEDVYAKIIAELLSHGRKSDIIYAVPGHPFIGESTVTAVLAAAKQENVEVSIVPGLSFVEPALTAVGQDGLDGLQLFDAIELTTYTYPPINPDVPLLLGQVYNRLIAGDLKMILLAIFPYEHQVTFIHAAGTEQELIETIPLYAIDRSDMIDHLTSLYVPQLPVKSDLSALAETVGVLRGPNGCPWDQEQTPKSMRSGFLEEVSEVLEALDSDDFASLCEELGDLLYHIVMQIQMAAELEEFKLPDVIAGIETKLKRRHPHVWGDWEANTTAEVLHNWELLKKEEKENKAYSLLDNIPDVLPALASSQKIQSRVRQVGFDWPEIAGVYDKLEEEIKELKAAKTSDETLFELGDILFVISNLAIWLNVDAESALREANSRFSRRFRLLEELMVQRNLNWEGLDFASMDKLWEEVKKKFT